MSVGWQWASGIGKWLRLGVLGSWVEESLLQLLPSRFPILLLSCSCSCVHIVAMVGNRWVSGGVVEVLSTNQCRCKSTD